MTVLLGYDHRRRAVDAPRRLLLADVVQREHAGEDLGWLTLFMPVYLGAACTGSGPTYCRYWRWELPPALTSPAQRSEMMSP